LHKETIVGTNKRRLHKLESVIRPPAVQELSADERAVLTMLAFTRRFLPALLRDTEAWHASGRAAASSPAEREAAAATGRRLDRLLPALIVANTRTNELVEQGKTATIIDRLMAWGLWREPDPPPPDAEKIIDRLGELASLP
jgi:hypothetical protein